MERTFTAVFVSLVALILLMFFISLFISAVINDRLSTVAHADKILVTFDFQFHSCRVELVLSAMQKNSR